jgi:tetratricopeptide (TPR) repeat protein
MSKFNSRPEIVVDVDEKNMPKHAEVETVLPPDADPEDLFNDFWRKNGNQIFTMIGIAAIVVVAIQSYKYWQVQHEKGIQSQYVQASKHNDLPAFIEEHSGHRLAALATLEQANALYAKGDYVSAATEYSKAQSELEDSGLMRERAVLGEGMSLLMQGSEEAIVVLDSLAAEVTTTSATRAEAWYHLAVHYLSGKNAEKAQEYLIKISEQEEKSFWNYRAQQLQETNVGLLTQPK